MIALIKSTNASQACSARFSRRPSHWKVLPAKALSSYLRPHARGMLLDALLQRCHREALDDCPGWLRLHDKLFAECHALARLRRRLDPCLDHAHAWEDELPCVAHLLCHQLGQNIQDIRGIGLLHLTLLRHSSCNSALGQSLGCRPFHCLHGCHVDRSREREATTVEMR